MARMRGSALRYDACHDAHLRGDVQAVLGQGLLYELFPL